MTAEMTARALVALDTAVREMDEEDALPLGKRQGEVYARGYAVIATLGAVYGAGDRDDPDSVRAAIAAVDTQDDAVRIALASPAEVDRAARA